MTCGVPFMAVSLVKKEEVDLGAKNVRHPTMKLRKLQVPLKEQKKTWLQRFSKPLLPNPKFPPCRESVE